jgi:hypothetical protein
VEKEGQIEPRRDAKGAEDNLGLDGIPLGLDGGTEIVDYEWQTDARKVI